MVPALCMAEVGYFAGTRVGWEAEIRLLMASASGEISLEHPRPPDLERAAELVSEYRDLPLGTVDATLVAAAERLDITTIATLDRRHFGVVRPAHAEAFELLPTPDRPRD